MVILSVGMTLKKEAKFTADLLGMALDEDGFIIEGSQTEEGIFATGACTGPKDIERSLTQAKSTAAHVYQYLIGSNTESMVLQAS